MDGPLDIPEYVSMVRNIVKHCTVNYRDLDHRTRWEIFKIKIKEASIKFGIKRAKDQKEYINKLQFKIDSLNKQYNEGKCIDIDEKTKLEEDLKKYYVDGTNTR